jgi:hypothetical protein
MQKKIFNSWLMQYGIMVSVVAYFLLNDEIIGYRLSAQTRTGIGLLEKPPAVNRFPAVELRRTRLQRDPAQTQVFRKARDRGIN